jgi:uncharacterized protein (TIGR00730 family)
MKKKELQKAYQDNDFLNSAGARSIRLLAELLGPQQRLRREGIKDTIVFFGSARIQSMAEVKKRLNSLKSSLNKSKSKTDKEKIRKLIDHANIDLQMARYYEDAVQLSKKVTQWTHTLRDPFRFVVCSGGGPGIMEAANKGAYLAKGRSMGLNISLPTEQSANRYITDELNMEFHYFFMRKFWFVYLAKAFVMFPGGFGTIDELMEVLTLIQTHKLRKKVAVFLYVKSYWTEILDFNSLLKYHVISPEDIKLFRFVDTPEEAFNKIRSYLCKNYPLETA